MFDFLNEEKAWTMTFQSIVLLLTTICEVVTLVNFWLKREEMGTKKLDASLKVSWHLNGKIMIWSRI